MKNLLSGLAILLLTAMPAKAQTVDREFKWLSAGFVLSSGYDAWTTVRGLERCSTCREGNPLARPFIGDGDPGRVYRFAFITDVAVIGTAYALKKRGRRWRWLLIGGTAAHVIGGTANLRYAF